MTFRIIVNECGIYRVEKLDEDPGFCEEDAEGIPIQQWYLEQYHFSDDGIGPRQFTEWRAAKEYIDTQMEAKEWERKRNTWTVVEQFTCEDQ